MRESVARTSSIYSADTAATASTAAASSSNCTASLAVSFGFSVSTPAIFSDNAVTNPCCRSSPTSSASYLGTRAYDVF